MIVDLASDQKTGRATKTILSAAQLARVRPLLPFAVLFLLNLALAWQALDYPMTYDDLHLMRSFSAAELVGVTHGNWDLDNIETPGLRPFTVYYNYARFVLFGENMVAQHLFLIVGFALFLALLGWVAQQLGLSWRWALLAGLMALVSKYSVNNYIWLTDGIHVFQGLLFVAAVILLFVGLKNGRLLSFVLSGALFMVSVLAREDTLALAPVLVLLGYAFTRRNQLNNRSLAIYSAGLIIAAALFWICRIVFVPDAQALAIRPAGVLVHLWMMYSTVGLTAFDTFSTALVAGWQIIALAVLFGKIAFRKALKWRMPFLWLLCAVIACAPGLTQARANLVTFPVCFFALFFCSVLSEIWSLSRFFKLATGFALAWAICGGLFISFLTMQSFHPFSSTALGWSGELIYGDTAAKATIPQQRRQQVVAQLAAAGINSAADYQNKLPLEADQALAANRRAPGADGVIFVPLLEGIIQP